MNVNSKEKVKYTIQIKVDSYEELFREFDYREVRDSIYSRRELNRVIKSLKRINRESQQRIRTLPSGEQITQWKLSELKKAQKRAVEKLLFFLCPWGNHIDIPSKPPFEKGRI